MLSLENKRCSYGLFKGLAQNWLSQFESNPCHPLNKVCDTRFAGAGVYALFYQGDHPLYRAMDVERRPLYVGKAELPGVRQGLASPKPYGPALYRRLNEHRHSLDAAYDLDPGDFVVRLMAFSGEEVCFLGALESVLIRHLKSVWNVAVGGFGNHAPGKGCTQQSPSDWADYSTPIIY